MAGARRLAYDRHVMAASSGLQCPRLAPTLIEYYAARSDGVRAIARRPVELVLPSAFRSMLERPVRCLSYL